MDRRKTVSVIDQALIGCKARRSTSSAWHLRARHQLRNLPPRYKASRAPQCHDRPGKPTAPRPRSVPVAVSLQRFSFWSGLMRIYVRRASAKTKRMPRARTENGFRATSHRLPLQRVIRSPGSACRPVKKPRRDLARDTTIDTGRTQSGGTGDAAQAPIRASRGMASDALSTTAPRAGNHQTALPFQHHIVDIRCQPDRRHLAMPFQIDADGGLVQRERRKAVSCRALQA